MIILKLIQTSLYQWELRSPTNKLLVTDIAFPSQYAAENWVKSYISGFPSWTYEIVLLKKGET